MDEEHQEPEIIPSRKYIPIGLVLGMIFGIAFDELATGMIIGIVIGVIVDHFSKSQ